MDEQKKWIVLLIVLFTLISILNLAKFSPIEQLTGAASSNAGTAALCINNPPTITSLVDKSVTSGTAFSYQVVGNDTNGNTLAYYDNTSLFNIDSSGLISFTPTSPGNHSIEIIVSDSTGCSNENVSDTFTLAINGTEVVPPVTPPASSGGGGGSSSAGSASSGQKGIFDYTPEKAELKVVTGGQTSFSFATDHKIVTGFVGKDHVIITVSSVPKTVTLYIGDSETFDIDGDGINDIKIELKNIKNKQGVLEITYLREGIILSDELIKVNLRQAQSLDKIITIKNDWGGDLEVVAINGLKEVTITPEEFSLEKDEEKEITFKFNPNKAEPNVYNGLVEFKANDQLNTFTKYLSLIMEIGSDDLKFDVNLNLNNKLVKKGEPLEGIISIFVPRENVLGNVTLTYTITTLEGIFVMEEKENISLKEKTSFLKQINLPRKTKSGKYILAVKATYEESLGISTEMFTYKAPTSLALSGLATSFNKNPIIFGSLFLLIILILVILLVLYKINKGKKIMKEIGTLEKKNQLRKTSDLNENETDHNN